jgi:hypothetical protein
VAAVPVDVVDAVDALTVDVDVGVALELVGPPI